MPKPLSEFGEATSARWGEDVLPENPQLAVPIAQVFSAAAAAESARASVLAAMLRTEPRVALSIFLRLPNHQQSKALRDAAEHGLDDEERNVLKRIEKLAEPSRVTRDKFAHCQWGVSEQAPGCLLRIPNRHSLESTIEYPGKLETRFRSVVLVPHDDIEVWERGELESAAAEAWLRAGKYRDFEHVIRFRRNQPIIEISSETATRVMANLEASMNSVWQELKAL